MTEWVESFSAWVWEPPRFRLRVRGMANATLHVEPGRFTVEARGFYAWIAGWSTVSYTWPVVVVETLQPLGGPGVLFDMSDRLARCTVAHQGTRLREALDAAGFTRYEVRRWGYEAPAPVPASELGADAGRVPAAICSDA